jgi:hypothetical protein
LEEWREWASSGPRTDHLGWGWNDKENDEFEAEKQEVGSAKEETVQSDSTPPEFELERIPTESDSVPSLTEAEPTTTILEEVEVEVEPELEKEGEKKMNVRPFARFPSRDPTVKYLSFENHSGFHNRELNFSRPPSYSHSSLR